MNNEIKQLRTRLTVLTSSIEDSFLSTDRKNHYLNQIDEIASSIDGLASQE